MKTMLSILILSAFTAAAADETDVDATFFHPAASLYIQGDTTGSSNLVVKGLSLFPQDGKLLRLKELLDKQQNQQQDNQNQQQDNQNQQQDNQNQQQDNQNQQQDPDQQQQDQDQQAQPEPPSAEQMSRDEAEQLLDAMRQEEQNKLLQLHPVLGAPVKVEKDW